MQQSPILWSFRRCPYAMRARRAILSAQIPVQLREILLRDKPAAFRATSPKATVPVLDTGTTVIDESRDVMLWALTQSDPEGWLKMPADAHRLIDDNDGPFKAALDHTKYAVRFPDRDATADRAEAARFLHILNTRLAYHSHLTGHATRLADAAIQPFVRQFANTDRIWFDAQDWPHLIRWLTAFEGSAAFAVVMQKFPLWTQEQPPVIFPAE